MREIQMSKGFEDLAEVRFGIPPISEPIEMVSEIHLASQTCFLPVLISGKMPKQLGDELSIYLFNTNASFFDLVKSDVFCLVLMKIIVNHSASIISPHGRTGDHPCDMIACRIYDEGQLQEQARREHFAVRYRLVAKFTPIVSMKGKVNPGIFKANPSDFSRKYLDMEKILITTVAHTEDTSTYFDFWDMAKKEEMQVLKSANILLILRGKSLAQGNESLCGSHESVHRVALSDEQSPMMQMNWLTVNPKPCDAPVYAGFTGRFLDSYCTDLMSPDKHIYCRDMAKQSKMNSMNFMNNHKKLRV
ncbi:hypothetical protein BTVI_127257 [Pitangus sulphuratus]|nr:hypothetical protein BTVI_127257 [Pitangus sulphuratus]